MNDEKRQPTHVSIGGVAVVLRITDRVDLQIGTGHYGLNPDLVAALFVPIKPPKMVTIPLAVAKDLLRLNAVMGHNFRVLDAAIVAAEREEAKRD